jgi:hypothetical protein
MGDLDKLVRNVLDALTDAQVYRDDVQVVSVTADKLIASEQYPQGVLVRVERAPKDRPRLVAWLNECVTWLRARMRPL